MYYEQIQKIDGELRKRTQAMFSNRLLFMETPGLAGQKGLILVLYGHWMLSRGPTSSDRR